MPVVPFVGATYQMEATSFDNQRCVNLYPILSESGSSKSVAALRGTSGLELFTAIGGGSIRGGIESANRGFFVSGDGFYEIFSDGTSSLRGTLDTSVGLVDLQENPTQIMLIDFQYGYIFNKSTNNFSKITDEDFPTPSDLTFQDGYFIVTSGQITARSDLNNGLAWDALNRTTVESSPDELVGVISDKSNLWYFGTKSTEVFQNTGVTDFSFQRLNGAYLETGCAAQGTIKLLDNAIIWLGTDENGDAIVWRSNGYNAQRISTQAIERKIAESTNFKESYAWCYHERGHAFYMLQIKGLSTTLVLDLATNLWHERNYRNPVDGSENQHRGSCHIFFKQMHLVGDRTSGKIFKMSLNVYSDNGDPIVRRRISPHYAQEKMLIPHSQFELDMEVGVGLQSGQGSDPKIMMRYSDDGGRTWSGELWRDIGKVGKYLTRVVWRKLGSSRDRVYDVSISDPVFVQINEAILNGK
jgi:hypothetical protein